MADTLTAPAPDAGTSTTPTAPQTFADAASQLKALGDSWGPVDETPVAPTSEAAVEAAVEQVAEQPETAPDSYDGWTLDEQNRLHRKDGTYATAEEVTAYNATIPEPEPTEAQKPAEQTPEAITVELRRRDGTTRTIEVDDPELAEELRTNANDGMRAREFRELKASYDQKIAELNAFDKLLETNPEHVFFNVLPVEKQISIATKLIAQHWDALGPTIVRYAEQPTEIIRAAMQTQMDVRQGMQSYNQALAAQRQAGELAKATVALIPDSLPETLHEQFLADAEADITRAVQAGKPVTPETIPQILAARLQLYGAAPTIPTAPTPSVRAVRPSPSMPPAALKPTGPKAASLADVKAQQARTREIQANRRRAAAVPPSGAGATPAKAPLVPPGASIEQASQLLRQQGGWRPAGA